MQHHHYAQDNTLWPDIRVSISRWRQWTYLAWVDIVSRYRRSLIGPLWLTFTTGFMLMVIGSTFSLLWHGQLDTFMPYFGVSYILWTVFSTMLNESPDIYIESAGFIQNYSTPKLFWVLKTTFRNMIVFAHLVPLYIILALFFPIVKMPALLQVIPALPVFILHCLWIAIIVSGLSTRYRDIRRLIGLLVFLIFMVTPILWKVETLQSYTWVYELNPVYYMLELMRAPLLGNVIAPSFWFINIGILAVGFTVAIMVHRMTVKRLFFWL